MTVLDAPVTISIQRAAPASRRTAIVVTALIFIGSIVLLFTRLGHYALWDDEAITAMTSRRVWQTGDTSVRVDEHNLLVYRNGLLVRNFKDRYTPPLQFYLIAPFIGLLGETNIACRLPFALCGLVTVTMLVAWLWKARPPALTWWAAAVVLLTNAEFFLFFRQCRYYGLAMMLTMAIGYFYCCRDSRLRWSIGLSIALAALLAAQYLNYAAAIACLVFDYAIWGRKKNAFTLKQWFIVLLPQLIVGGIVCSIWNPIARQGTASYASSNWFLDRLNLLWWNWRDMLACDFIILPLLLLCPLLYLKKKSSWLLRAPLALVVYLGVISLAVATQLAKAYNAEVRYLAPTLPLCVGIGIVAVWGTQSLRPALRNMMLVIAAMSLLLEPAQGLSGMLKSTPVLYYNELIHPQDESYTPVIAWINANIKPNQSIYVQPGYKTYPLMFRAPGPVYAWQLTDPPRADFTKLPGIHFHGRLAPDYIITFGPGSTENDTPQTLSNLAKLGTHYRIIATIPHLWKDLYRPERIWRAFTTDTPGPGEEIYVYRRAGL